MITRLALFITLLAVFYFYCNEDTKTNQYRGPNDINMIQVPQEISPSFLENSNANLSSVGDSISFLSSRYPMTPEPTLVLMNFAMKNN